MYNSQIPHRGRSVLLLAGVLSMVAPATVATAQQAPRPEGRVVVSIAVTGDFKYRNTDAVLLRRAGVEPHDVLVIRAGRASAQQLAEAVATVQAVRSRYGDIPTTDAVIRVRPPNPARKPSREAADWADMLSQISANELPGVGKVAHLGVWLPRSKGQAPPVR